MMIQDQVEITEGISLQDEIVVAGAGFLNDGDLVRVTRSNAVARDNKRDTKDAQ